MGVWRGKKKTILLTIREEKVSKKLEFLWGKSKTKKMKTFWGGIWERCFSLIVKSSSWFWIGQKYEIEGVLRNFNFSV